MTCGIVVHGGAGSSKEWNDGCEAAARKGDAVLKMGGSALDAVVEAVIHLENDGRYNAGKGSVLRIDGKTIECDAAIMSSNGKLGSVMAVRNVKNPVLLARRVADSPHVAVAGTGAEELAKKYDLNNKFDPSISVKERYAKMIEKLRNNPSEKWGNYLDADCDTVGAVALDINGALAVACSTGGANPMLVGRVGDTPLPGCGFYCSQDVAITATGIGEEIIRKMASIRIAEMVSSGISLTESVNKIVESFPPDMAFGVIAIDKLGEYVVKANRDMACAVS